MPRQALIAISATLAIVVATLLGCSDSNNGRVPIQGLVTLEGEPIQRGSIALRPANGGSGLSSGGEIRDGKFTIPAKTGPTIGQYSARVTIVETGEDGRARFGGMKTIEATVEISAEQQDYVIELSDSRSQ